MSRRGLDRYLFKKFLSKLETHFGSPIQEETAIRPLETLKIKNDIYRYSREFRSLLWVVQCGETIKKHWYMRGLPYRLQKEIGSVKHKSFRETVEAPIVIHTQLGLRNRNYVQKRAAQDQKEKTENVNPVKTNFCNVCKKVGHNSERCYFNKNRDRTKDLKISALFLRLIELDSREGNESDAGESVYIPVQMMYNNRTLELQGLIDTGRNITVLNEKWIDKEEKERATASHLMNPR
jgi:hypothetical protein